MTKAKQMGEFSLSPLSKAEGGESWIGMGKSSWDFAPLALIAGPYRSSCPPTIGAASGLEAWGFEEA